MAHILAKLQNVKIGDIREVLKRDAPEHARQGLYLEHLWQNASDPNGILFLFRTNDLEKSRQFIEKVHAEALQQNPEANLPQMTFLKDE